MGKRILVAGAIGRRLCLLLVAEGWPVTGTTRSMAKASALGAIGVEPVLVDVFGEGLLRSGVIHQLTDLPPALDPDRRAELGAGP